ncbi:hypothetical protein HanPI659440_Chr06g0220561 [Helianthus annuus]|uniref:Uncharacterized protein n=1 Tax=Helianthus annuus TaxID=4232 RepID=A0A9K3I0E0_HELAN|nr:hypothetical protein HanXRQr2_Chr10g0456781 [Helianthus annuus]KAJ0523310.1 hypothetical protein HanIR_Chr10g0492381 [Helianthus annuus]KAJ0778894.1 hypothetical protein HanPI659440_Chr06g0220561 [Helianthus annuus]
MARNARRGKHYQEPKRVFIKTLNHKKFSQIKGNQARKLGLLIN